MQVTRRYAIGAAVVLGVVSAGFALALNITWVIHWREVGMVVVGVIFFAFIIAALALNTIFLVREFRRSEQQDSFLNSVTHELKTPIASIRLYLQTLQSRPMDDAQRAKFYAAMSEDTDRLIGTVDQVLRAGQLAHKPGARLSQPVSIATLAEECVRHERERRNLAPEALGYRDYTTEAGQSRVLGDPEDLRTALLNVIDNAIKYSPQEVRVSVAVLPQDNDVLVRVGDRGVGIPKSELKRVFRRFYRVPQIVKYRIKGTGLGLYIVRAIARRHGGDAFAQSEGAGLGTTVTIRLPKERV